VGRGPGRAALTWLTVPAAEVATVARGLLGWRVSANGVTLRLTEVEAYGGVGEDPASHAYRGRTRRNAVMFGPAGFAYVYFVFGMHWCLNVVVGQPGAAAAVLLRAGEVVAGEPLARTRRGSGLGGSVRRELAGRELARGPARLAAVLGLDGSATGTSLVDGTGPARLAQPVAPIDADEIVTGPRVGVAGGAATPWRFYLAGDASVSPYRPHVPRRRPGDGGGPVS
jgi:DNA-3-methyladenine glycosylase